MPKGTMTARDGIADRAGHAQTGDLGADGAAPSRPTGTDDHVDRLIDLIGADIAHDLVTVTRYSATKVPEFVKHRRFSDAMVRALSRELLRLRSVLRCAGGASGGWASYR